MKKMKNRWQLIALVVVAVLLLGGGGYYLFAAKLKTTPTGGEKVGQGVFSNIQEALSKSLSLQCTFTDEQNRAITAYIKAGAVRADIVGKDDKQPYNSSSIIMKDKKLYVWDRATKKGMLMALSDEQVQVPSVTETPSTTEKPGQQESAGNVLGMLQKYKNDCKVATIADDLFAAPADVEFTDVAKMMPSGVPSGVPSGAMNEEQVKQMMQQYQPAQ